MPVSKQKKILGKWMRNLMFIGFMTRYKVKSSDLYINKVPFYSCLSACPPHSGPERKSRASSRTSRPSTSSWSHTCKCNHIRIGFWISYFVCVIGDQGDGITGRLTLRQRREQVWPFCSLSSVRCRTAHSWEDQGTAFLLPKTCQETQLNQCELP